MKFLRLEPGSRGLLLRRGGFALVVAATVVLIAWRAWEMLRINGLDVLKVASFALFVILLVPIALSFWTAVIGFVVQWRGGDALDLSRTLDTETEGPRDLPRTAVVMPVYNEDPTRVFAGIKATYESVEQTGWLSRFD